MAIGDNRVKRIIGGTTYWHNPNTDKWFLTKTSTETISKPTEPPKPPPAWGDFRSDNTPKPPPAWGDFRDSPPWLPPGEEPPPEEPPPPDAPPKPSTTPPPGWEWFWNGANWIMQEISDYKPEKPGTDLGDGWEWEWNDDQKAWVPVQVVDEKARAGLKAQFEAYLETYGLNSPGMVGLIEQAVANDWSMDKFLLEMRKSDTYLANPLFAANLDATRGGARFKSEGEILTWRDETRRLADQFGFARPSDNYLAMGFLSGMSMAEFEHRLQVQQRVNEFGGGVAITYRMLMGVDPSDQDLYEIFDKEISTKEFDDKARQAEYRGRPLTLGLGIRSEAEARAFEMMGVDPGEAYKRYESVAANADRFARLGAIEDLIGQGLPADFDFGMSTAENSTLMRAFLFNNPEAEAQVQNIAFREIARWKAGGGVQSTQGQLTGLLSETEKASYG